jgi:hypothetical protein
MRFFSSSGIAGVDAAAAAGRNGGVSLRGEGVLDDESLGVVEVVLEQFPWR